jgi:hypothetical protein
MMRQPGDRRPDDGDSKHLWNVGQFLPEYKVQLPRRQSSHLYDLSTHKISNSYFFGSLLPSSVETNTVKLKHKDNFARW